MSVWVTSSLDTVLTPTAIALGNFDGVHRGHWQVIQPVLSQPVLSTSCPSEHSILKTVVTFHPHPQEFFSGQSRLLLTPRREKALLLQRLGIDQLVLLPFDRELANLSPEQFIQQILIQHLQVTQVSVGADFRFGHQRSGTAKDLQSLMAQQGVKLTIVPLQTSQGERISSSAIRAALAAGDLQQANRLLGRPYSLVGEVVPGQRLGRTIGFPTANLQVPSEKLLPQHGVYCVRVQILDPAEENASRSPETQPLSPQDLSQQSPSLLPGVMNFGYRPTVNGREQVLEIHLLDWVGDLYGQTLMVMLEEFLRPEKKFASLEDLKQQIQADCDVARSILMASTP